MFPRVSVVGAALLLAACHGGTGARSADMHSFHGAFVGAPLDPTVRPARLLPAAVDESVSYGAESGGGVRGLTAGLRVVTMPKGALAVADDRLPAAPQVTTPLPERLGGGFLFTLGATVWRADRWLGPAKPIFTASASVQAILPGLDRVYLRVQNGTIAVDGRDGKVLDLGPYPASPQVSSYAAADGWRAAAVSDLRGVVATFDAGATWRIVDLPIDPKQVVVANDSLAVAGFENGKTEAWFELRADGGVARLGGPPRDVKTKITPTVLGAPPSRFTPPKAAEPAAVDAEPRAETAEDFAVKTFGKHALAAAIEDGWPLTDGTAVVARDGALARIRLSDGALTEVVRDAFPFSPATCHPVTLTRKNASGAFGFVCGEPRGTTIIYAYEPLRGRLSELKRFDRPRVVTSSGNGALAVRGPCAIDGEPTPAARPEPAQLKDDEPAADTSDAKTSKSEPTPKKAPTLPKPAPIASTVHPYCVLGHDDTWCEIHVRGDTGTERIVVLADGRIVVLTPPESLGAPARLTLLDHGQARTLPVVFPKVTTDVARMLRLGFWLDGFEERRPNVVGGWIEAGGAMLGVEIALDGNAVPGSFVRDAGLPFVAGRYGLGWSASRRGYETTDGGMTWTSLDLPDALVPTAKVDRRACGPVGCLANGWLRVGWGEAKRDPTPSAPPAYRPAAALALPTIALACEPLAPPAPAPRAIVPHPAPGAGTGGPASPRVSFSGGPPVLGTFNGLLELPPFLHQPAPAFLEPDRGINIDVHELAERYPNLGPLARVYGWGPKTGDWETLGHWQVRWLSPFAGWPEVHTSLTVAPPAPIIDLTRGAGYQWSGGLTWQLATGDDAAHAMLVGRRRGTDVLLFELEADRAPLEVHRADGEPFGDVEALVRAGGRWLVATAPMATTGAPVSIVWQVEGGVARELARIPRALGESVETRSSFGQSSKTKLARRSDGRAVGFVVDGQPTADRAVSVRWVLPIDLESGAVGEPESLGYADLAGRTLGPCTDDQAGWTVDSALSASVKLRFSSGQGSVTNVFGRLRLSGDRACVERLAGTYGEQSPGSAQLSREGILGKSNTVRSGEVLVTVMSAQTRYPLRCAPAK